MTSLRVIAEPVLDGDVATRDLLTALVAAAPPGCDVEAIVAARPPQDLAELERSVPGLACVHRLAVRAKELPSAWRYGVTAGVGGGMLHAPTLLAPLTRHDRDLDRTQSVVTVRDARAVDAPASEAPADAAWQRAMLKRAAKHADAVVVPSHAVAERLQARFAFGDRLRVIPAAGRVDLASQPADADARAARLPLPERYVLATGPLTGSSGLRELIAALALDELRGIPLVVLDAPPAAACAEEAAGRESVAGVAAAAGLPEGRVVTLDGLDPLDQAVVFARAAVFADAGRGAGFGTHVIEAFTTGTPVVHSDDPALCEAAADAGAVVRIDDGADTPRRLAEAIATVLDDPAAAERMRVAGADRARAFSWRDAADRVWQLHADL